MADDFPKAFKSLRAARGMSQKELAEAAGVHPSYISKIENGQERPGRDLLEGLARALGADPVHLVLAAGRVPREFASTIAERDVLKRLLNLASRGRLSEGFYATLAGMLDREDRVTVPVWLE